MDTHVLPRRVERLRATREEAEMEELLEADRPACSRTAAPNLRLVLKRTRARRSRRATLVSCGARRSLA